MRNIALTGKARAGKDTVADVLVKEYGYVRVAFADELKRMALEIDPVVLVFAYTEEAGEPILPVGLALAVERRGWEYVKDNHPEVRRFLQQLGSSIRKRDPFFWVRIAEKQIMEAEAAGKPVVVTDVRYINEADTLQYDWGFSIVRITRPGLESSDTHESETEMDGYEVDWEIHNGYSVGELRANARHMLTEI